MIRSSLIGLSIAILIAACGDSNNAEQDACDACVGSATCDPSAAQACMCPQGFAGDGTMTGTGCANVDECVANTDNCVDTTAACTDTPGSFTCACNAGYAGDGTTAGTGCTNIDECVANTDDCVALATCNDTLGAFTCTCNSGFQGDGRTGGTGCVDIDECAAATDDCDAYARCDNTVGGFECRGLYATSPFQNFAWRLDPATWEAVLTIAPDLAGSTVNGTLGLAVDPTTNTVYGLAKVSGVTGRVLTTVDTRTMVYTSVGDLGDKFSSLTFDSSGQLFGVTGNGATVSETLYTIDKASAGTTLAIALGNGADGEVIAYNPIDQHMYHWSGNGTVVFEKFPATPPYTPVTDIPITGTAGGETFGAWWDSAAGDFAVFNISSRVVRATTTGAYTGPVGASFPDDLRSPAYGLTHPQRVVPAMGNVAGGYTVQLHSHGFSQLAAPPQVTFNGVDATNVTIDSDTQLTVTVPAGAPGPVMVRATDGGNRRFSWPDGFTYTVLFAPVFDRPGAGGGVNPGTVTGGCAAGGAAAGLGAMIALLVPLARRLRRSRSTSRR